MGIRAQNLKGLFSDARSRTIIIITFVIFLFAVVIGYFALRHNIAGSAGGSTIKSAPGISSIPGSFNPSPEYSHLVQKENLLRAQQASKTGSSALPTIIRDIKPGEAKEVKGAAGQSWKSGLGFKQLSQVQKEGAIPKAFVLDALKGGACDQKDLDTAIKAGVSLAALRKAGCAPEQLRQVGFTSQQLQAAGFSACDLMGTDGIDPKAMKSAGYSAGELRGVGYNACQLKKAGFTPGQLAAASFTADELKGVGFSPEQIAAVGGIFPSGVVIGASGIIAAGVSPVSVPTLPSGITASALKSAGCGEIALKRARSEGVSAAAIRAIGCRVAQLRLGGYTVPELRNAGYSAGDLSNAAESATQLRDAGFSAKELRQAGYRVRSLKNAGFSAEELKEAGFSAGNLHDSGFSAEALRRAGFTDKQLENAGLSSKALLGKVLPKIVGLPSGVTIAALKAAGCGKEAIEKARSEGVSASALKQLDCTAEQLETGGISIKKLKAIGYSAADLLRAGLNLDQLKAAGYAPIELAEGKAEIEHSGIPAGISAAALKTAGFGKKAVEQAKAEGVSALALKNIGFTSAQLKRGGYTLLALKTAGFTSGQLKRAGFTARQLKEVGFTPYELRQAGFLPAQLEVANYTPAQLRAVGFTAGQLADAGISLRRLKNSGFSASGLMSAGFTPVQLKRLGFNAVQLKDAGFSALDLKKTGYTSEQLKRAGYTLGELKRAGYTPEQLQQAGFQTLALASTVPPISQAAPVQMSKEAALAATAAAQQREAQAQQARQKRDQLRQQMQSVISGQVKQLFSAWVSPTQTLVQGGSSQKGSEETPGNGSAGEGASNNPAGESTLPPMIKGGSILFAVLDSGVNSDYPGPVLATIVSGKYKGARLMGQLSSFPRTGKKIMLTFNMMSMKSIPQTISINAVAMDPDTARTALSSHTNNHYFIRFGSLFAASFLEGYGQAFSQSGQTIVSTPTSTTLTTPQLSPKGKAFVALGNVGNKFGSVLDNIYNMPPTVEVYSGTGLAILFLSSVAAPS